MRDVSCWLSALDVPDVVSPAFGEALRVGDTLDVDGIDPAHAYLVQVRDESGDDPVVIWQVASVAGGTFTLPPAPAEATIPASAIGGQVLVCDIENPGPDFVCRRTASSRAFDVEL